MCESAWIQIYQTTQVPNMALLTMIGRVDDGLLLCASGINDSDFVGGSSIEYQNQAKQLFRTFQANSPPQLTIETGPYVFHCLIENRVCYLCLCERAFSKRLAFSYLEELASEFQQQYGQRLFTANRPYSFIEFGKYKIRCSRHWSQLCLDVLSGTRTVTRTKSSSYWSFNSGTSTNPASLLTLSSHLNQIHTFKSLRKNLTRPVPEEISTC